MDKKIQLVVVEPNGRGGLIHYAYQMCTALAGRDFDVRLVTSTDYELIDFPHNFKVDNVLNLWEIFDPQSMQVDQPNQFLKCLRKIRWNLRRVYRAFRLIREWFRLVALLQKIKPDVIQFGKINFPFENFFLRRLREDGLFLSQICHEFERRESSGPFAAWIDQTYAKIYTNFSMIFFHAEENRARFLSLYPFIPSSNTFVIPHGNENLFLTAGVGDFGQDEARKRYGFPQDVPVVLFFGILSPSKGLDDLINAFAIVNQKNGGARLVIAGYPSKYLDVRNLKNQATLKGVAEKIIFDTRYIPFNEVGPLMKLSRLVVFPYRSSTQSGALQVAYAFGRPVIATAVGGLPEVVENGKSGFVVPPNDPADLAEKILTLVEDSDLAEKMGAYALKLSKTKFSWDSIAQQLEQIYQGAVKSKIG